MNKITDLPAIVEQYDITDENYENLLSVYTDDSGFYYFNLIGTVNFPVEMAPGTYTLYKTTPDDFYTAISYKHYNTIKLWWVICAANQIMDPTAAPDVGRILRIPTPSTVSSILSDMIAN
jgi:nucleoid-associated protein YgaU